MSEAFIRRSASLTRMMAPLIRMMASLIRMMASLIRTMAPLIRMTASLIRYAAASALDDLAEGLAALEERLVPKTTPTPAGSARSSADGPAPPAATPAATPAAAKIGGFGAAAGAAAAADRPRPKATPIGHDQTTSQMTSQGWLVTAKRAWRSLERLENHPELPRRGELGHLRHQLQVGARALETAQAARAAADEAMEALTFEARAQRERTETARAQLVAEMSAHVRAFEVSQRVLSTALGEVEVEVAQARIHADGLQVELRAQLLDSMTLVEGSQKQLEQHAALQAMQREVQRQLGATQMEAQRLQSALGTALRQRDEQRHLGDFALNSALADADAVRAALSAELSAVEREVDEMRDRWSAAAAEAATAAEARAALRAELEEAAAAEHERLRTLQVRGWPLMTCPCMQVLTTAPPGRERRAGARARSCTRSDARGRGSTRSRTPRAARGGGAGGGGRSGGREGQGGGGARGTARAEGCQGGAISRDLPRSPSISLDLP